MTRVAQNFNGREPVVDHHAIRLRPLLLGAGGRHCLGSAPVDQVHVFGTEQPGLHGGVDRRHAPANHDHAPPDGQGREIGALAQARDEIDRIGHAAQVFAGHAQGVRAGQAHAQKQGVKVLLQCIELRHRVEFPVWANGDAADFEQPLHLALRKVVGCLVARQAVFIETTGLGARIKHHDLMAQARQRVGAGQSRRAGADHGDLFAACGRAREQLRPRAFHQRIDRMALQAANGHGPALLRLTHAHRLAQVLGRADARAHAAQRVGFENGAGGAPQVGVGNAPDERGHLNARGAGGDARGVKAVQAALSFEQGLRWRQARRGIGEAPGVIGRFQAAGANVGQR